MQIDIGVQWQLSELESPILAVKIPSHESRRWMILQLVIKCMQTGYGHEASRAPSVPQKRQVLAENPCKKAQSRK